MGPIARRVGTLGVLGLGLLVMGLIGYYLVSNYDVLFAGRAVNTIGSEQSNYVMMMALATAAGGGLALLGFLMARGAGAAAPMAYGEMEGTEASAEVETGGPAQAVTASIPPSRPSAAEAAPEARPEAPPTAASASDDLFPDEDEEEVGALELPGALPEAEEPAEAPAAASAPAEGPSPAAASSSAADEISTTDELEDLFGELESEVEAAAEEEDVMYECPNCHGIVKEDDASCPHCQVVFEA